MRFVPCLAWRTRRVRRATVESNVSGRVWTSMERREALTVECDGDGVRDLLLGA